MANHIIKTLKIKKSYSVGICKTKQSSFTQKEKNNNTRSTTESSIFVDRSSIMYYLILCAVSAAAYAKMECIKIFAESLLVGAKI